jgi:hypothetical protein
MARALAVVGLILGLGSGLAALGLRKTRRGSEGEGKIPMGGSTPYRSRAGAASARELRMELALLLGGELKGTARGSSRWEEVLLLFRALLLADLGENPRGQTTPEILLALRAKRGGMGGSATEGEEGGALAEVILREGDRMRFGGGPVSPEEVRASLLRVRSWMEVGRA